MTGNELSSGSTHTNEEAVRMIPHDILQDIDAKRKPQRSRKPKRSRRNLMLSSSVLYKPLLKQREPSPPPPPPPPLTREEKEFAEKLRKRAERFGLKRFNHPAASIANNMVAKKRSRISKPMGASSSSSPSLCVSQKTSIPVGQKSTNETNEISNSGSLSGKKNMNTVAQSSLRKEKKKRIRIDRSAFSHQDKLVRKRLRIACLSGSKKPKLKNQENTLKMSAGAPTNKLIRDAGKTTTPRQPINVQPDPKTHSSHRQKRSIKIDRTMHVTRW
mmetsp:Transcript_27433/g.46187  ORF Transcript_27433/g.46187 Transcript_27433/m.46187 type:complete len:273 (+) Transcript_27433:145-963(+)